MGRAKRLVAGGMIYHVLNRANVGVRIFETDADYLAFEKVIQEAQARTNMRVLSWCVMPNHWHLAIYPRADGDLARFVGWLSLTHTQRWHAAHATTGSGHVYQGRYKSFPIQHDAHFVAVCRFIEQNPLRVSLVDRAEKWRWSSLAQRASGTGDLPLSNFPLGDLPETDWPIERPADWVELCNKPQAAEEVSAIQLCINRGRPFGDERWQIQTCRELGLELTMRPRGRPPRVAHSATRSCPNL